MHAVFIDDAGNERDIGQLLPKAIAGERAVVQVKFKSLYTSTYTPTFELKPINKQGPDPRLKIISFTRRVEPGEIGILELESIIEDDPFGAVPFALEVGGELIG